MFNPLIQWLSILFGTILWIPLRGLSSFRGIWFRIPFRVLSGFRVTPGLVVPSCMPNRNNWHYLPKSYGARKYVCPVWIRPTYNFQQHPRTSISINKLWSDQLQITITQQNKNNSKLGGLNQNQILALMGNWSLIIGTVIANRTNF